jgi:phosphoribosyl 1,2-cyclic phosphodiesterase
MRITFYGTRGSIPVCGSEFHEFGGNTTCLLVEGPSSVGILDAGSGIRELGKQYLEDDRFGIDLPVLIGFTHFHWDHIQGLPFFQPAYDPRRRFIISAIGKERLGKDLRSIFATQMQRDYFPVPLEGMGASISFHQSAVDSLHFGEASITTRLHNHPGDAYSYRIEWRDGTVLVFCTDIEHGDSIDQGIVELARGADLLIHEGQYTPEELPRHRGWGHSSWQQAVEVAEQAEVKQLVVTHHDPDHDDAFLERIERQVQQRFANSMLAREKVPIEI